MVYVKTDRRDARKLAGLLRAGERTAVHIPDVAGEVIRDVCRGRTDAVQELMRCNKLTPKLSTGVKVRYNYIQDDRYAKSYTTSTYGGSIFGRYLVTSKFYAQAEAASYNYEFFYLNGGSEREWVPFLFMGGGFIQPLSERTWLNIEILFDVLQDEKSPYEDWEPFFSIGIGAGF